MCSPNELFSRQLDVRFQGRGVTPRPMNSHTMHSHPLARLTQVSRERLIRRHLDEGLPLKVLAAKAGISLRNAYKRLACFRAGGVAAQAQRRWWRKRVALRLESVDLGGAFLCCSRSTSAASNTA